MKEQKLKQEEQLSTDAQSVKITQDLQSYLNNANLDKEIIIPKTHTGMGEKAQFVDLEEESQFQFNLKPLQLEQYLKEYIIGQEDAISVIATKICTHFNRMVYERKHPQDTNSLIGRVKSNILMIGPTGVGKTYMIRLVAQHLGVPFVKADATKFTETGYVGGDVEDLVRELVRETNGDIELAGNGIIYIDEIDKIASSQGYSRGPDVSRTGVQRNLLKIMEESEVELKNPLDMVSQMENIMQMQQSGKIEHKKINTRNILFVVSGAFQGLIKIIEKRVNSQALGFQTQNAPNQLNKNTLQEVSKEDLLQFGFESEFVGRLPIVTVLNELHEDDLYTILKNPKSNITLNKKRDFDAYGIKLDFSDQALKEMAHIAYKEKTGARSLISIFEKSLLPFEKHLPSTCIHKLNVDISLLNHPMTALYTMLTEDSIEKMKLKFLEEHHIKLIFSKSAFQWISNYSKTHKQLPYEILQHKLNNYEYGLKLIQQLHFEVTEEMLKNNKEYLNELIQKSYHRKHPRKVSIANKEHKITT